MTWPGEKHRHAMSARGVRTVMDQHQVDPDMPGKLQTTNKARTLPAEKFFEKILESGQVIDDETYYGPINAFNSDGEIIGYIIELEKAGAIVHIEPMSRDRPYEYSTIYVDVPPKMSRDVMEVVVRMKPDEFHQVKGRKGLYRLWWD